MADLKENIKNGNNIELDGATVINNISLAEKKEVEQETNVDASKDVAAPASESEAPKVETQNTPLDSNPALSSSDPVPSPVAGVDSAATVVTPIDNILASTYTADANTSEYPSYDSGMNQYANPTNNEYNQLSGAVVFKNADSVTSSRDQFLSEIGGLFDKNLKDPIVKTVILANDSMKLVDDIMEKGPTISTFEKYKNLKKLQSGIIDVNEYQSNMSDDKKVYDDEANDLSKLNIRNF